MSSSAKVLTLSPTRSCGHRPGEDRGGCAAVETIPAMRAFVVVELQKPIERSLQRATAGEVLPPKGDAPVLMQDGLLQALDEPIGPRVTRLRSGHAHAKPVT